jgi:hypothetical protein
MNDLDERFRALRRVRGPDLWPEIEGRAPTMGRRRSSARWVAAAAAFALAGGGLLLASRAFRVEEPPARSAAVPPEPVVAGTTEIPGAFTAVPGEGSLWVGASALDGGCDGTIHRIDPRTGGTIARIPVKGITGWETGGGAIDVQPGAVWVAGILCGLDRETGAVLQRIDPATNEVDLVADLGGGSAADVASTGDAVWVTVFRDRAPAEVVRMNALTGDIEATIQLASSYARELLAAEGAVWVVERRDEASPEGSGVLVKIDPARNEIVASPGEKIHPPAVWEGQLWARRRCAIVRIDAATARITGDRMPTECVSSPILQSSLRPGAGGLWFFETGMSEPPPELVRMSTATGEIDVRVEGSMDRTPIDFAVTETAIWIVNYEGSLTRVDLRYP